MQRVCASCEDRIDVGNRLDVFEPVVGSGVFILGVGLNHYHLGGNGIAGMQVIQRRFGLDLVGHGHGFHETGDGVAVNDGGLRLGVDRNDAAGEGITFRGRRFRAMARRTKKRAGKDESD